MILLDTVNRSLEIKLAGGVTTNQLPFVSSYIDVSQSTFLVSGIPTNTGASNNTTAVTLVAAPAAATSRQLKFLSIKNSDTVAATVIVQYNDNATLREIGKWTLAVNDTLQFIDGIGFNVISSSGSIKLTSDLVIGTTVQAYDADLTTWAGITPGANVGAFLATPSSANLASALTDETGTGAAVFATSPTIATPSIDTINLTGGQIAFPAAQAASAGANTLDDYEEGTWTPVLGGSTSESGQTYASQVGVYTKTGRIVTAACEIKLSAKGTINGTYAIVKGLPFAAALIGDGNAIGTVVWFSNLAANWVSITGANIYTSTSVLVVGRTAATAAAAADVLTPADVGNTTNLRMFFSYHV